jgi:DHA1 family inner membrane transport protein
MSLKSKMPLQVWILTLAAFAIGTAEFVIAGILPEVASSLRVTEGQAGNLITACFDYRRRRPNPDAVARPF